MRYKTIGGARGLKVSAVGIGTNAFGRRCDAAQTAAIIDRALGHGINFIDTADSYGDGLSEEFIGRALGPRRRDAVIATKFGMRTGGSRKNVQDSVDASLKRLGTDFIDLFQFHRPDPDTPIEETLVALDELVTAGKVRYIGCSNFTGRQLADALAVSAKIGVASFVTAQNPYNMLRRDIEADLVPVCRDHDVGILPYYPVQRGVLTGKYARGVAPPPGTRLEGETPGEGILDDATFDRVEALQRFAKSRGHNLLELAMSWLASQPVIASVIAGVTKPDQVAVNAGAADWVLSAEDMAEIDAIVPGPRS